MECPLTSIELETIRWFADGKKADEIAEITGAKVGTVYSRLFYAREKTGAATMTSLAVMSVRNGWIK